MKWFTARYQMLIPSTGSQFYKGEGVKENTEGEKGRKFRVQRFQKKKDVPIPSLKTQSEGDLSINKAFTKEMGKGNSKLILACILPFHWANETSLQLRKACGKATYAGRGS